MGGREPMSETSLVNQLGKLKTIKKSAQAELEKKMLSKRTQKEIKGGAAIIGQPDTTKFEGKP